MGLSEALQIKQMPTLAETPILCHLQLQIVYFGLGEDLQDMSPKAAFRTHQRRARHTHGWPGGIPLYLNTLLIDLSWDHLGVRALEAPQCLALMVLAEELVFNLDHAS